MTGRRDRSPGPASAAGTPGPGTSHELVEAALAEAHRREWAFVLAATVRTARDLDLAEECVQEAYAAAVTAWARDGVPASPAAWLTTTARRRAVDTIRRDRTFRSKLPLLIEPDDDRTSVEDAAMNDLTRSPDGAAPEPIADERLRLIFLCCHPALAPEGQVALTLRLVCGISTSDIARAFLVSEPTMAARITRAKKKIAGSRIPFRMPSGAELTDRLEPVLQAIYLLFTTGHTAPAGPELVRVDLSDAAIRLARTVRELMPDESSVAGLLALLLVTDARRDTRVSESGRLLRLEDQDRSRWNAVELAEGHELIVGALRRGRPDRYTLQAAIASLYAEPPTFAETDWPQALYLYDQLLQVWPTPVVALNRTVPLSYVAGPAVALAQIEDLERDDRLAGYPYLAAVKAELLTRLGRTVDAAEQYRRALELTDNPAEREFLLGRLESLDDSTSSTDSQVRLS